MMLQRVILLEMIKILLTISDVNCVIDLNYSGITVGIKDFFCCCNIAAGVQSIIALCGSDIAACLNDIPDFFCSIVGAQLLHQIIDNAPGTISLLMHHALYHY